MKILHESKDLTLSVEIQNVRRDSGEVILPLSSDEGDNLEVSIFDLDCKIEKVIGFSYYAQAVTTPDYNAEGFSELKFRTQEGQIKIGYLFPLPTICNPDSDLYKSETSEFTKGYALGGIIALLSSNTEHLINQSAIWGRQYKLSEIYQEDTSILVISPEKAGVSIEKCNDFISNHFPMLAKHGAFLDYKIRGKKHTPKSLKKPEETIYLEPKSPEIDELAFQYLKDVVMASESNPKTPLYHFFLQYQFMEILMNGAFKNIMSEFSEVSQKTDYISSPWKLKKLSQKLNEKCSEQSRLNKIFEAANTSCSESIEELKDKCKEFLQSSTDLERILENGEDLNSLSPSKLLYRVRNCVFHGFGLYKISEDELFEICQSFSQLIYELATRLGPLSKSLEAS
ncbi:MAG: hypothetical protein V7688_04520 [Alcanivorax jadensis]|uniref:hypothetical protein n=1 Tax=Alcanivorax jadensis TaxID=64988 RepID=UPI0030026BE2